MLDVFEKSFLKYFAGYPPAQSAYPPAQANYGAPPPAYPATQQPTAGYNQQSTTVVVTTPRLPLNANPVVCSCPHCQASVTTQCTYNAGLLTWLAAGGICLFG